MIYNAVVVRCQNNIIKLILGEGHECQKTSDFEALYRNFTVYGDEFFYFINHYVDILNYTNPFKKYFQVIETFITKNSYNIKSFKF